MKQLEYIGFECINNISSVIDGFSAHKLFLVTGKQSYRYCGAEKLLAHFLKNYETVRFSDFDTNPNEADVDKATMLLAQTQPDAVIAVGGGSVIDMAKMANFLAANNLTAKQYIAKHSMRLIKGKPLIAIPTTAGSGSEATQFAVLYIDKEKFSIDHTAILPDAAIVDPQLTMSSPKYITAAAGMDCFSQAIESYWSIHSNDLSKKYAKEAILLAFANLVNAVNQPCVSSRTAMAKAANFAGKAINLTRTTACHSISYPLSSYFGIAHGHAVGLTLSSMLDHIAQVQDNNAIDTRGSAYIRSVIDEIAMMLEKKDSVQAKKEIDRMMHLVGLETQLSHLGIDSKEDIQMILDNGFHPARMNNNPRKVTKSDLKNILDVIY